VPVVLLLPLRLPLSAARPRPKIFEQSLLEIRAEMPTQNDDWEVETAVQYRVKYGKELRLSK
jgi:hypothetical protein